jgi:hypothetical protein
MLVFISISLAFWSVCCELVSLISFDAGDLLHFACVESAADVSHDEGVDGAEDRRDHHYVLQCSRVLVVVGDHHKQ